MPWNFTLNVMVGRAVGVGVTAIGVMIGVGVGAVQVPVGPRLGRLQNKPGQQFCITEQGLPTLRQV